VKLMTKPTSKGKFEAQLSHKTKRREAIQ
ncbi:hypothetical protein ACFMJW_25325, partial [Acinetobacter baumannii]